MHSYTLHTTTSCTPHTTTSCTTHHYQLYHMHTTTSCTPYTNGSIPAVWVTFCITPSTRCIKPNDVKSSEMFNKEKVLQQLRYTGVMEAIRIRKEVRTHTPHYINTHTCAILQYYCNYVYHAVKYSMSVIHSSLQYLVV